MPTIRGMPTVRAARGNRIFFISQRKFANCLSVLEEYGKLLGLQDDVKYIDEQFTEYKTFISDHLNDFDYLSKSEAHLRRLSENIDSKCDQIVVKFYN